MKDQNTVPTEFLNVQVTAVPSLVDGKVKYATTFNPPSLKVTETDTVINYQLIAPTPAGVQFKKLTIKPDQFNQFSEPSISESGKLVTFSDANTVKATFNITLHFTDKDGMQFSVDPEVENEPSLLIAAQACMAMEETDPEPENEPTR